MKFPKKVTKNLSADPKNMKFDWDFFDAINTILEYTNVVLNDLEIFAAPEIYSSFLRYYHDNLPEKVIEKTLNVIYKITIDKNHRIGNGRYNAMYSKDFIKCFNNIFYLYCYNIKSKNVPVQQRYFNLLMKLIYHNILLVNDKTLCSSNLATDFDATKDMTSFYQMNRGNGVIKDRLSNRNIRTILKQNPSIFDDLQLWFVKLSQEAVNIGQEVYKERMIQLIFLFVYLLIGCKDQSDIEPVDIIIQTKDYLFKYPQTTKYGMLFFMLIFSDKYNKASIDFKKLFINSNEGVDSLIVKLNESENKDQLMRNMYLVCLICLETSQELKLKVITKIDLLKLFDHVKLSDLTVHEQKTLISYIIEMCCLSNEMLYFPIQDQIVLKQMFDVNEMHYVKEIIDNVFINLSEFLPKNDEDDIMYTENDFLSASQANFWAYAEDEEEQTIREAFAFIESDFLNSLFIILFQLDKKLKVEFLNSLVPLIEQRTICKRILSRIEILEFFLRVYQYHRDNLTQPGAEGYEVDCEFLNLLLKLISFSLENGIPIEDDMYLYSLIKGSRQGQIDEKLLIMLCAQVEYCDIPNNINFKETTDSFGLAAFISKGKALEKFDKEIWVSPYISNLPSRKKGFWFTFWFRLKKLYDNMILINMIDFRNEKVLRISLSILREFESVAIQDRLGINTYDNNFGDVFSRAKIKKILEIRYCRDDIYIKENVEIPFELEVNKVYHLYWTHQRKTFKIYLNNYLILEHTKMPYQYPGNLECPAVFQISAIDKSITPVVVLKGPLTDKELSMVYNVGEMCDNSLQMYVKDYKKKLICSFPNIAELEPFDEELYNTQATESNRIDFSEDEFHNNDSTSAKFKSHEMLLGEKDKFYIRFQPKINNFKKMRITKPNPEDAVLRYIMHVNLKQYLSGNNMFSIIFSFIHMSRGSELIVLWALLHRNPYFMNLLFDLGGIDLLKDLIVEKHQEGKLDEASLMYLFNIAWNEPISTVIKPTREEVKQSDASPTIPKPTIIPKLNEPSMDFLDILILIVKKSNKKTRVVNQILSTITFLLQEESNRIKFENRYGKHLLSSLKP